MRKYELDKSDAIGIFDGIFHHRLDRVIYTDEFIEAYKEEYDVIISRIGGWIESEKNLSQDDYSVVLNNVKVWGNAIVRDNAIVRNNAVVQDNAIVRDNAVVQCYALVQGNAVVHDNAIIENFTVVGGKTIVENIRLPL